MVARTSSHPVTCPWRGSRLFATHARSVPTESPTKATGRHSVPGKSKPQVEGYFPFAELGIRRAALLAAFLLNLEGPTAQPRVLQHGYKAGHAQPCDILTQQHHLQSLHSRTAVELQNKQTNGNSPLNNVS